MRWLLLASIPGAVALCTFLACGPHARPNMPPPEYEEPGPMASFGPAASAAPSASAPSSAPPPDPGPLSSLPYTPSLDLTSLDRSADPCVDFYEFSCGGWVKNNPLPADQAVWDVYAKLADDNRRLLWGILQDDAQPKPDRTPAQQKIGDYFSACMDEAGVEAKGATPLQPSLAAIAAMTSVKDLPAVVARLQLSSLAFYTRHMLFGFGSDQDFADSSKVIAFASAGGLGLPDRDYYTKTDARSDDLRKKYVAHVTRMLTLLGDAPDAAAREAGSIMGIETRLAGASLTRVQRRDPHNLDHKMSRAALQAITPAFDWGAFLTATGVPSVTTLNVSEPAFYKQLQTELASVSIDDWKAYLRWHVVHAFAKYLASPFAGEDFDFYSHVLRGVPAQPPRWKRCVSWIDNQLGEALGEEFVRRTFTPETRQRAATMTAEIERAMQDDLQTLAWMGPATRKQALTKLHSIVNKIGYPDHFRDYGAVTIARDDFEGDVERALVFESRRRLAKIGKPVDRGEWQMTPPTVNAYYDAQMDDINFPAGVLQPPLFDAKLDDAPNYGDTGSTIGHELTHGFDDEGRKFDAKGNLRDWWTKPDGAEFEKRAQCVVDQYAQYTIVDDIKINSRLTEGEDVADLGGTILAYAAWKHATQGQKLDSIDGFTPDQRFFVGFAQWACEVQRPENLRMKAVTDPHSPAPYRVNGVVANMPEFQAAFSCKQGQPMVRSTRCRVW
jgi:endothelin-converting enzyme/putative endopeptidase